MPRMSVTPGAYELPAPRNEFPADTKPVRKEDLQKNDVSRLRLWKDEFSADRDASSDWRDLCKEWMDFVAGRQWLSQDLEMARKMYRIPVTVNLTRPVITMVRGHELKMREDIVAFAREEGDARVSEVATAALDFVRDNCNASYVWSEAFWHCLQCGMGWVGTRIDYDVDPDGTLIDECLDPMMMYWDYAARARNLQDARRLWQVRIMDVDAARDLIGEDLDVSELDAVWTRVPIPGQMARTTRTHSDYKRSDNEVKPTLQQVRLVERQWWDIEEVIDIQDPETGEMLELSEKDASKHGVLGLAVGKRRKRVYKRALIGRDIILEETLATDSMHWQCITGNRDEIENRWYGMTVAMMDAQRWTNNFLTQTIHIYKTMGKGGLLYETGAFLNPDQAVADWSKATAAIELNPGKLQGAWAEKPSGALPAGLANMIPLLIDLIRQAAGVNPEMLGMSTASTMQDPSGLLEMQRQEAGLTMIAEYFDSMNLFRRMHGRLHLDLIAQFMSDGRLIRIVGDQGEQYVPMILDGSAADYDLITEGVPTSPNNRERNWKLMQPILPLMASIPEMPPELWVEVAKISPLPPQFAEKMAEALTKKDPSPEEQEKERREEEMRIRSIMASIRKEEEQANKYAAGAQLDIAKAEAEGKRVQLQALDGILNAAGAGQSPPLDPNKQAERDHRERESAAQRDHQSRESFAARVATAEQAQANRDASAQGQAFRQ